MSALPVIAGANDCGREISHSLERLTLDYSSFASSTLATRDAQSKEQLTRECCRTLSTVSGSEEVCCNIFDYYINPECDIVFEVNNEGQSVVKDCFRYRSDTPGDCGPMPGDVLCGVDKMAVIDSYYAESLLDDRKRDTICLRFMRGDGTPKTLPNVPIGGAPPKRPSVSVGSSSPKKDLEYFRKEFFVLATKAFEKKHYKWALKSACKVLNICKLIPECHDELLSIHDLISLIYDKLGLHSKALGHLQIALSVADICSLNVVEIVDLRQRMGRACRHIKDYEVAIDHYNCALQMIRKHISALSKVGRTDGPAWAAAKEALIATYVSLGKVYRLQGDRLDLALNSETEALKSLRSLGCLKGGAFTEVDKVLCRVNICLILGLQGDLSVENETEMVMAVKSLERSEHATSIKAAAIYRGVSNFYELRRDWERAILYRQHEIKMRQPEDTGSATLASAFWRVAVYYRYCRDYNKSFIYRVKAIEMVSAIYGDDSRKVEKYATAHRRYCNAEKDGTDIESDEPLSGAESDFGDKSDGDIVCADVQDSIAESKNHY